ncbi:MAG: pyrroline-5-carboxylate reductase [Ruminococcaceae bacterium]|nr:pyrroline-5-carboxylate reductase [Oscillospiraceae bacterium]
MKIGFIGAGNMASAIVRGLVSSGVRGSDLLVYDVDTAKQVALFEECGICMCGTADEVIDGAEAVILAVKPQVFPALLPQLAPALHESCPLVISIAAGKTVASIEEMIGGGIAVVRVMPNINAKVGESMSAFCCNALVSDTQRELVVRVFDAVGETVELAESQFSVYAALAGCSPAYSLLYMDALAQAGVQYGIPKALSLKIVAQAVLGTARLLQESDEHPRELIDQVCSPGGTTIEGVAALQKNGFESAVLEAVRASYEKDRTL